MGLMLRGGSCFSEVLMVRFSVDRGGMNEEFGGKRNISGRSWVVDLDFGLLIGVAFPFRRYFVDGIKLGTSSIAYPCTWHIILSFRRQKWTPKYLHKIVVIRGHVTTAQIT
jgi:hypothetical protein